MVKKSLSVVLLSGLLLAGLTACDTGKAKCDTPKQALVAPESVPENGGGGGGHGGGGHSSGGHSSGGSAGSAGHAAEGGASGGGKAGGTAAEGTTGGGTAPHIVPGTGGSGSSCK